ncbi:MAG: hypothetical protein HGA87_04230 [Desulfobulbaceae bacterium]|nr:hypothetical protein [Desulfobulbaceae bacterium]
MSDIPNILKSTQPLLYETGFDEWPYAYAGSCFPVRWDALCVNIDVVRNKEANDGLFTCRKAEYSEESAAA